MPRWYLFTLRSSLLEIRQCGASPALFDHWYIRMVTPLFLAIVQARTFNSSLSLDVHFSNSACKAADCLYSKIELKKDWKVNGGGLPPWYKTSTDQTYVTASPRSDSVHSSARVLRVLYPQGALISASGDGWKVKHLIHKSDEIFLPAVTNS